MIRPEHFQEWLDSCVDPDIITLNVKSLWGNAPFDRLFYSDAIERLNTGRLPTGLLRKYKHIERGGWWCVGLDPENSWSEMLWGCFKPDYPRRMDDGKAVRYEVPLRSPTRAFFLRVPLNVWKKVAQRHSVAMPENIVVSVEGEAIGFWSWALSHPGIPITIVEGAKKAGAVLTAGYVAIALPGVNNGYRASDGRATLIPDLELFASAGRTINVCFDRDVKRKTIRAVNAAIAKTGNLFEHKSCTVRNVTWSQPSTT